MLLCNQVSLIERIRQNQISSRFSRFLYHRLSILNSLLNSGGIFHWDIGRIFLACMCLLKFRRMKIQLMTQ